MIIKLLIILIVFVLNFSLSTVIENNFGVDLIFNRDWKLLSADVFVSKNLYFIVLQENGKSFLKTLNLTQFKYWEIRNLLEYPVQSAETVAVDWINGNLYWADKANRFIEVVDLNHGLDVPINRQRRRLLFTREMGDIFSLVVDPNQQYLFWLHMGADMVLERAQLDGSDRRVIHRSSQFKSSHLAIDRHRKMLFWWGMDDTIHRVDYQGQTGCSMHMKRVWKHWSPAFLTFSDQKLMFINDDRLWVTTFTCGVGTAMVIENGPPDVPTAIIPRKHQLVLNNDVRKSPCVSKVCSSICLPNENAQYRCACMTGIKAPINNSKCPTHPNRSLIIASPPKIYHISLDTNEKHLEPLFEHAGIPFRLAYDSLSSSMLYLDYNTSSIFSLHLDSYGIPHKLSLEFPIFSQIPASFALDSVSRNIYWMSRLELWVARITSSHRLSHAALLLSWLPNSSYRDNFNTGARNRQGQPPGELAVDSFRQYLFVSVISEGIASIERYWLDGTHKFTIIKSPNIVLPRGLALDPVEQQLFFVDAARDEMICIDYQGANIRLIGRNFPDFFGLTYIDGFIYWTDIESLSVNIINTNGSMRSPISTTYDLRSPTMPILALSRNSTTNIANDPCHRDINICDQLCFPTRLTSDSYSCGCSNAAHVFLNLSRCSHSSKMIVYYNTSSIVTHQLSPSTKRQVISINKKWNKVNALYMQMDHLRNHFYWIDEITNCVMKTSTDKSQRNELRIFCLSLDRISGIALDVVRNNLYVSISSSIWSRINVIRLPFPNSDISWRKFVTSSQIKNKIIGAVAVHSSLKYIFWFESQSDERFSVAEIYQANLDGSQQLSVWSGIADIEELTTDDHSNFVCWKNSDNGKIYRYNILTKAIEIFQLSLDILNKVLIRAPSFLHVYPVKQSLYIFVHDSIYQFEAIDSTFLIKFDQLKRILHIGKLVKITGFSLLTYQSTSTTRDKVALSKPGVNSGSFILCPTSQNDIFVQCSQFCLPTTQKECDCGSIYSLHSDGSTCTDSGDYLMVMTNIGEIIGIRVNIGTDKYEEIKLTEWIDIPEQKLIPGQKFIDAVYWLNRDIVLRLDNHGYLSAVDQTRPSGKIKVYKKLTIQDESGNTTRYSNAYEKIYKHFLEKDAMSKDLYESSRFSLAIDLNSDILLWSDWVNGIIAAERLNADRDRIEFLGVIINFHHTSRRPLQIAIAPISSSLVWLSADLSGSNDSSIWRQFWIEMSDLDGSRRSVLLRDPGIPSCLTVDMHSGRVYWIDTRTNKLMYLHIYWDKYQFRAGHVFGQNMRVAVSSLLPTGVGSSTSSMVVMKKYIFWTDWFQQIVASTSLMKSLSDGGISEKTQVYNLRYLRHKLKGVVRIMSRISGDEFKTSSLGTLLQNHPCSHITNTISGQRCSHLCLSTLPISLTEEYSFLMTTQQLAGKFRCACPLSMMITPNYKIGVCVRSQFVKCDKHQFVCRAGQIFSKREGISSTNCMPAHKQCDLLEDCLDGSDEVGCSNCNSTHSYSCSASALCLPLSKRCDGIVDCESDEKCCGRQRFECLSGSDSSRCLTITDRCNGIRDCIDGSDESKCHLSDVEQKPDKSLPTEEHFSIGNLSNNHTVAIIAGTVAISACTIAIIYICLSRRSQHKTIHESCLFRANNVNIMFMSPTQKTSRPHRFNTPYQRPGSHENIFHARSCDIIDNFKIWNDGTDHTSQSLTSLSDCYRRIKNPQPYPSSVLGRPLFSMHDDILYHLSRIRKQTNGGTSDVSIEKIEKPPPSVVTTNSEDIDKFDEPIGSNRQMVSRNSLVSSLCESELEEIYVHRYQLMRRPSALDNYPSCLLQNLLSACNQTSQLQSSSPTTTSRDFVIENVYRRRKRKLFKYRSRHHSKKPNLSLSPSKSIRSNYSYNDCELYVDSSSNPHISPPPPSPITVVST